MPSTISKPNGLSANSASFQPTGAKKVNGSGAASSASASTSANLASEEVRPLLQAIYTAPSPDECAKASSELCAFVNEHSLRSLETDGIKRSLVAAAGNKKSGYERESAAVAVEALAYQCGGKNATPFANGADVWLLDAFFLPMIELHADKGDVVREAAEKATSALFSLVPQEAAEYFLETYLFKVIKDGAAKWQSKIAALKLVSRLSEAASEQVGELLEELIPVLTSAMHETKSEISKQAVKTAQKVCQNTLENNDLRPFIPDLVGCMARPDSVPECIKKLSSTTFVAEVTGPALAVMVPLLTRALNERSQTVQRSTVIVVENLCKLVHNPQEAEKFLPALTPGVQRIEEGASFPEVREHARSALDTLQKATKELEAQPKENGANGAAHAQYEGPQAREAALQHVVAAVESTGGEKVKEDAWGLIGLKHVAAMLVHLANKRTLQQSAFDDVYVLPYLRRVLDSEEKGKQASEALRQKFLQLDAERFGKEDDDDDDQEGECLCNIQFSLAYGGLLLLNNTRLKLYRGHRYGIVATNGSGKSTLLKAMRDGKVEGYPTQDVLRTIMVEHSLQGEDGSQPILDFVCKTPGLEKKTREQVADALREVGFTDEKQGNPVGSLSGGWKMKLELARAMLNGADILLLDEPTNHLDVQSVAWLEKYLVSHNEITVLTVSHDSGFLDNVCTDIMHYETKKIKYYKGNLSDFVKVKPEAKTYYSLNASVVKFSFPEPGHLMGVRSNTRTILKLTDATFTYPGMSKPSLRNASAAISLSSRVGVLGPNGAGKSTLIKCLTGEVVPQEGKVEKHPALRVALMAQHAFHHIEQHLEKTACQYIMWRYEGGQDKELSEKASRKLTDEEEKQLQVPIVSKTGEKRRIEYIVGRSKLKKSFQYEIKWQGLQHKFNTWIPRERLLELGFFKMVQSFDDFENSREGTGNLELNSKVIRKHLEAMGLNGEIAEHHELKGLSGGQKVKVCLCAALIANPQVLILDEPTNYLDRDSLGGLAVAIKEWAGAVIIISHNMEFVEALCPEIWNVEAGQITSKTRRDVDNNKFDEGDGASTPGIDSGAATPNGGTANNSRAASRLASKAGTPISSAAGTPAGSGDEKDDDMSKLKAGKGKKKKLTRNEKKAQEERRRARVLKFLTTGEKEPDTDED